MNERSEKLSEQKVKDDALMNFVNRQAQEAILNPDLPESYKDYVVDTAIGTLLRIAERKNAYDAKDGEQRQSEHPHTIYEAK